MDRYRARCVQWRRWKVALLCLNCACFCPARHLSNAKTFDLSKYCEISNPIALGFMHSELCWVGSRTKRRVSGEEGGGAEGRRERCLLPTYLSTYLPSLPTFPPTLISYLPFRLPLILYLPLNLPGQLALHCIFFPQGLVEDVSDHSQNKFLEIHLLFFDISLVYFEVCNLKTEWPKKF